MTTKSRRNIVRNVDEDRYWITSRRLIELDSVASFRYEPWYALLKDIKAAYSRYVDSGSTCIHVYSRYFNHPERDDCRVLVNFGHTEKTGIFHIGCGFFDVKNFTRILKAAGVKTTRKALAAKAGA